jgi:membrane associated rhomboid family serine protease
MRWARAGDKQPAQSQSAWPQRRAAPSRVVSLPLQLVSWAMANAATTVAGPGGARRGRFLELVDSTPLVTLLVTSVCVVVYVADNLGNFGANLSEFALVPYLVVWHGQLWRIVTAAFTHGGLLHIAMNMFSFFSLGKSLETLFGSLHFFFLLLAYTLGCGLLYVAIELLLAVAWDPSSAYRGAVGFSGVIFALAVNESALSPFPTRSVFGLFSVPTKLYPWVLMLVIQFAVPGISFVGHLAGILLGGLHSAGWLAWALPSFTTLRKLEQTGCMRPIMRTRMYKLVPSGEVVLDRSTSGGLLAVTRDWLRYIATPITQCFGRFLPGGATGARRGGGAGSGSGVVVDDTGRLRPVGSPTASAAAASGSSGAAAAPSAPPVDGAAMPAHAPGPIAAAAAAAAGFVSGGSGYAYDRLSSTEEAAAADEEAGGAGKGVSTTTTAAAPATTAPVPAAVAAARAEVRAKAAAAAEARAAAARTVGLPSARSSAADGAGGGGGV